MFLSPYLTDAVWTFWINTSLILYFQLIKDKNTILFENRGFPTLLCRSPHIVSLSQLSCPSIGVFPPIWIPKSKLLLNNSDESYSIEISHLFSHLFWCCQPNKLLSHLGLLIYFLTAKKSVTRSYRERQRDGGVHPSVRSLEQSGVVAYLVLGCTIAVLRAGGGDHRRFSLCRNLDL